MKLKGKMLSTKVEMTLTNTAPKSVQLTRARIMSISSGEPEGFPGWLNGELDSPVEGERVHQVTVKLWLYTRKPSKKPIPKHGRSLVREVSKALSKPMSKSRLARLKDAGLVEE